MLGLFKKREEKQYLMYIVVEFQRDIFTVPNREIIPVAIGRYWNIYKEKQREYQAFRKLKLTAKFYHALNRYERNQLNSDLAFVRKYGECDW